MTNRLRICGGPLPSASPPRGNRLTQHIVAWIRSTGRHHDRAARAHGCAALLGALFALGSHPAAALAGDGAGDLRPGTATPGVAAPGVAAPDVTAATSLPPLARRALRADDFFRTQALSDPQVAPDGAWVAYVVTSNERGADETRSAIWMVSWDGKQQLPLTNAVHGTHSPRFSPDGRYLAYIATPAGADHEHLMLLDRRGGEARSIVDTKDDIGAYQWSPDGTHLVIAMLQGTDDAKSPKPIVIDALHFKEDEAGYLAAGEKRHLFLLDLASEKIEALTSDAFNDDEPVWSPDGKRIAFVRTRAYGADPDGAEDIEVIEPRAGAAATSLARPYAPNAQSLMWSPDGSLLAFLQGLEPKYNAYIQDRLAVVPAGGGPVRALSDSLDRAVASYAFSADSRSITISVEDDRAAYPARIELASGAITRLVTKPSVIEALAGAAGHTAALYSDDEAPGEIYALEAGGLRKLSSHNDALLGELQLGQVEDLRFKSKDGTEVHGLIVKPPGFVSGKAYPTLLWIHGGPNGQDAHSFAIGDYQFRRQLIAANGYVVIGINYRGSSGRGSRFARAIFADWGHKEVEDLLAGVDAVVAQGIADPKRLGIGGWSYGGILTDYTIASDGRFKAAVSGAGSANQLTMFGSDQYIVQYTNELGPPWRNTPLWLKVSYPFFHADRIHTPTLFMGGDKDFNVPVAGGEQMYEALRTLGVDTQLVVYPGEYHDVRRPSFLKDRLDRIVAWFGRYLTTPSTSAR